jgi:hypothetical protein
MESFFTHSLMELRPSWEAANCGATQELPNILWKPWVHYRVHRSFRMVPILSQIDPVHIIPFYLSKIHFNIFTHLRLGLPSGLFFSGFPINILYVFLFSPFVLHTLPISSSLTWSFNGISLDLRNYMFFRGDSVILCSLISKLSA